MIFLETHQIYENLFSEFPNVALQTTKGEVLYTKTNSCLTLGCLLHSIESTNNFFKIEDGDCYLIKESRLGGGTKSQVTLVYGFSNESKQNSGIILALQITQPSLSKITWPIAPLRTKNEVNQDVLKTLDSALQKLILSICQKVDSLSLSIKQSSINKMFEVTAIQKENKNFTKFWNSILHEWPEGDFYSNSRSLRLRHENASLQFSFLNQETANSFQIPIWVTTAVFWKVLSDTFSRPIPIQSCFMNTITMSAPQNSWMHSPNGIPENLSEADLAPMKEMIRSILLKLTTQKNSAAMPLQSEIIEIHFAKSHKAIKLPYQKLDDSYPDSHRPSDSNLFFDSEFCDVPSIQYLEKEFPIHIVSIEQKNEPYSHYSMKIQFLENAKIKRQKFSEEMHEEYKTGDEITYIFSSAKRIPIF